MWRLICAFKKYLSLDIDARFAQIWQLYRCFQEDWMQLPWTFVPMPA
jgi:hypothetical protein